MYRKIIYIVLAELDVLIKRNSDNIYYREGKGFTKGIETLMKQDIPLLSLPEELEISTILTEDEKPKIRMKIIQTKVPKKEESGPAFHEKSAKNSKVNKRKNHKEDMQKKYGKPKTRGAKK